MSSRGFERRRIRSRLVERAEFDALLIGRSPNCGRASQYRWALDEHSATCVGNTDPAQCQADDGDEQYANNGLLGSCHEMCDVGEPCWLDGHLHCPFRVTAQCEHFQDLGSGGHFFCLLQRGHAGEHTKWRVTS